MNGVWFALLGTVVAGGSDGDPTGVAGARQRAVLACLLLGANAPVSGDALAEAVWDGSPPPGAAATLRSHIRRLRAALGPTAGARITACDPGYVISVAEGELDVLGFEAACRRAGEARRASRWAETSAAAGAALGLWRGTPLADVPSQVLRDRFVPRLEQLRLQAAEDRAEAELRLGRHDRLIPQLRELAAAHPMRERFHAQLIEALARAGRQAEALEAYQAARRVLVEELGIEPGPHLQRLHQQVLDGDPALAAPPGSAGAPRAAAALASASASAGTAGTARPGGPARLAGPGRVPRQLPGAVAQFTGRAAELAALSRIVG